MNIIYSQLDNRQASFDASLKANHTEFVKQIENMMTQSGPADNSPSKVLQH